MLITESSNVPLDSPLLTDFSYVPNDDEELINLVRNQPGWDCTGVKVEEREGAAITIQRMWRWTRTRTIIDRFTKQSSVQTPLITNEDLDQYLHHEKTRTISESNDNGSPTKNNSHKRHLPGLEVIRVCDLNQLISKQVTLAAQKYEKEAYFAK